MNLDYFARKVAEQFKKHMNELGLETFQELSRCYMWNSSDIKEEVDYYLREASNDEAYVDEEDGKFVYYKDETLTYKEFSHLWRKYLNQ